jgi:hypothetical protein
VWGLVLLVGVVACGRIGFDPSAGGDSGAGPGDADNGDVDNDGVDNAADNCADVANADQADEDSDTVGDACDGCPPVAGDLPDSDGDGVEDPCDPNPNTPGDRIALFEGFSNGIPAGWGVFGSWTANAGQVAMMNPPLNVLVGLVAPLAVDGASTTSVGFVPGAVTASSENHRGIGVAAPVSNVNQDGITCLVFLQLGNLTRRIGLIANDGQSYVDTNAFNWQAGEPVVVAQSHDGAQYRCAIETTVGDFSFTGQFGTALQEPTASIYTRNIAVEFLWVMHVDSP